MLNNVPISEDEQDVSYDVESLFTNISFKDTVDFLWEEIYVQKKLEPVWKQSVFKKLLYKLTTQCTFSATGKLPKQVDSVSMGGTLSVILSDCSMNKIERDIAWPLKPKFYCRFVDDTCRKRKKNKTAVAIFKNELLPSKHKFNNWHESITISRY